VRYLHSDIDTPTGSRSSATCGREVDGLIGINCCARVSTSRGVARAILDATRGLSPLGDLAHPDGGTRARQSTARSSCTPTASPSRWRPRSTRPSVAVRCRAYNAANESHRIDQVRHRELLQTVYERDYYTVPVEEPAVETFESPAALQSRSSSWRHG